MGSSEIISFKLNCPDLLYYVEPLSDHQVDIAIEGALNVVFNPMICSPTTEHSEVDWETVESAIYDVTICALIQSAEAESGTECDFEVDYPAYEHVLRCLVEMFSQDIANDKFNQDVMILSSEMIGKTQLKVMKLNYSTPENVLYLALHIY